MSLVAEDAVYLRDEVPVNVDSDGSELTLESFCELSWIGASSAEGTSGKASDEGSWLDSREECEKAYDGGGYEGIVDEDIFWLPLPL